MSRTLTFEMSDEVEAYYRKLMIELGTEKIEVVIAKSAALMIIALEVNRDGGALIFRDPNGKDSEMKLADLRAGNL